MTICPDCRTAHDPDFDCADPVPEDGAPTHQWEVTTPTGPTLTEQHTAAWNLKNGL